MAEDEPCKNKRSGGYTGALKGAGEVTCIQRGLVSVGESQRKLTRYVAVHTPDTCQLYSKRTSEL